MSSYIANKHTTTIRIPNTLRILLAWLHTSSKSRIHTSWTQSNIYWMNICGSHTSCRMRESLRHMLWVICDIWNHTSCKMCIIYIFAMQNMLNLNTYVMTNTCIIYTYVMQTTCILGTNIMQKHLSWAYTSQRICPLWTRTPYISQMHIQWTHTNTRIIHCHNKLMHQYLLWI